MPQEHSRLPASAAAIIAPPATIGIVGGGQLGRMTAIAAANLGYHTHIFTPEQDSPAAQVATRTTVADYADSAALAQFGASVQVVTFEFENIPHASLKALEAAVPVHPSVELLRISQNRLREKRFIRDLGIGTAPFAPITDASHIAPALAEFGGKGILKTTEFGYDGKGQMALQSTLSAAEAASAWAELRTSEAVLEGFVDFTQEISVIVARRAQSEILCYPPVTNIHRHHILDETHVPATISAEQAARATEIAQRIAAAAGLIGLLAVEMFVTRTGEILVNEIAPRPHNSGHWTMDAAITSQFEQLVRAVCNLPLGSVEVRCPVVMKNLIGEEALSAVDYLQNPNNKLHLYGKHEARPGRKMGHVNQLRPHA